MRVDREVGMVDGYENRRSLVEAACFGIEESIFFGRFGYVSGLFAG